MGPDLDWLQEHLSKVSGQAALAQSAASPRTPSPPHGMPQVRNDSA
jgi:hypothetical protein